jgi:tol-pal system protein YbgF
MEMVQADTQAIRSDLDSLRQGQYAAQQSLTDIQAQVREVQTKSEYGSSSLQEKVEGLAARMDEIVTRMDRALAPLEEFMRKQVASDTTNKAQGMGVDYYDAAMRDLSIGNYDLAEVGFLQYLEQFPNNDLTDDARYGLAETYYARKRYDDALDEYQKVLSLSPTGGKSPAAMLKIGLIQKTQGKPREARKTWEGLIKQFPFAEEAKVAQQRLGELASGKR